MRASSAVKKALECRMDAFSDDLTARGDAMADIAVIFHWGPAEMDPLPLTELMEWRERARKRSGAKDD